MRYNFVFTFFLIGVILTFACQSEIKSDSQTIMKPPFTYEVELAEYEFGQKDELGEISFEKFVKSFEEFPWNEQVEKANKLQKVSPTLSVKDNQKNESFWVSVAKDGNSLTYLLGHVYPKEVKGFLGFGKPKTKKWVVIHLTQDKEFVRDCFKLFFTGKTDELRNKYAKLEKYDEMESVIQD